MEEIKNKQKQMIKIFVFKTLHGLTADISDLHNPYSIFNCYSQTEERFAPHTVKSPLSIATFKSQLKTHLFTIVFYNFKIILIWSLTIIFVFIFVLIV